MALNQNGNDQSARVADAVKAQVNQTAAAAREGISKVAEFRDQATEHSQQTLRTGIDRALRSAPFLTSAGSRPYSAYYVISVEIKAKFPAHSQHNDSLRAS